jgi:hypothetical protein
VDELQNGRLAGADESPLEEQNAVDRKDLEAAKE